MDNTFQSHYDGCKVFSATMAKTRDRLSSRVTEWLKNHNDYELVNTVVTQSSDDAFHCLTISVFYRET